MLAERAVHPAHTTAVTPTRRAEPPVHVPAYDGPLDLLLFLVRKEGVALREIPVARICDAYLAHLGSLDDIDVDRAGDYLAMASTLCLLKARELLPRLPRVGAVDDEPEDPKQALERRLAEYERFRDVAEQMGRLQLLDREVFARPAATVAPDEEPVDPTTDSFGLARCFYDLLERRAAPPPVHQVAFETYTMAERVRFVLSRLDDGAEHLLSEFWAEVPTRRGRVVTLLATLEGARLQLLDLAQRIHLGAVTLVGRVKSTDADLSHLAAHEHDDPPRE